MRACARIVAESDGRGGTRLATLRGEPPLLLRQTGPTEVYLVGGAAGPLGGDDLRLEIEVRPGARLCVRTSAASLALPARSGAPSRVRVSACVGPGASLRYLPEQLVAAAGCRHETSSTVDIEMGGALLWREELVCGRHGEQPGNATVGMSVTYAGRALLRQTLAVGPDAPGWADASVLGGAHATGCLLGVDPTRSVHATTVLADTAVRVPLPGPAWLTTATAPDAHTLRGYLTAPALRDDTHLTVAT